MEEKPEEAEEVENSSSYLIIDDELSTSEQDVEQHHEAPLTEEEVEELIAELLEVESKAAEAQESLEDEYLTKIEAEVREELAQSLNGDDLEKAIADEMETFKEEWEAVLDELETESAHLLEQLDGAGIELPSLYKLIESQAPNGCCTEAWKNRAHWVGSRVTSDIAESITDCEKYLQAHRPVRRHHGRIIEEGASGFLGRKLATDDNTEGLTEKSDVDWSSFNKIFSDGSSLGEISFGSKHWASVYLASTPQQAAQLGLKFPGVDEVEEIDDIEGNSLDPFVADAIANERELDLTEEQKRNFRKVKEEDDADIDWKLQVCLKRRRAKKRNKQEAMEKEVSSVDCVMVGDFNDSLHPFSGANSLENLENVPEDDFARQNLKSSGQESSESFDELDKGKMSLNGNSLCTACDKIATEVHSHPLLKVIVCKDCKSLVEAKMLVKDPDCLECYCGWCGRNSDLMSCKSCSTLFCRTCIKRNLGESSLEEVQEYGWKCCCCSPSLLHKLTSQLEAILSRESEVSSSESDSDSSSSSDTDVNVVVSSKRRQKKKIRRILDDAELGEETKKKIAIEKERQERLKSLEAKFSRRSMMTSYGINGNLFEGGTSEMLGDAGTGYIVNVVREEGEEAVRIPPSISAKLKAHQIAGIRFMWQNIIESIRKVKAGDKGLGCILAHTMGLGKTFQVIAFLYAAMRSVDLGLKTALIVTPVSVLHNWRHEFMKWRPVELKRLNVFMLEDVSRERRAELLSKWRSKGGIFLIGYTSFRNLSLGKYVKDRCIAKEICHTLQEGPDILVCDEAHMIKNTRADVTQALKQVKCQRRIALTGSPLQNNLMEYYCMVDFVREGFLGSSHEFRNRYQNPIENGQHTNSTIEDVKIMNQRSHILYEQLKGFVQRMDMTVIKKDLPPKVVVVIAVKLSPLQRKLYKRFLDIHGFTNKRVASEKVQKRCFFAGYQALAQIWNHPGILQFKREDKEYRKREDIVENFLADDSSSDDNTYFNLDAGEKQKNRNEFSQRKNESSFIQEGWWNDLLQQDNHKEVAYSGKMILLVDILTMCSNLGDKALVFSQSLYTLDLIEFYLSRLIRPRKKGKCWKQGKDWYRLDGRTEASERQKLVERFNDPLNKRVKCILISTRAGSLGINLHAANRVVIVDGSWNPTYDLQAIYRAWRYGQVKPVFAYRLLAHGTMEEKIYKRQVTKEGLAARVVDRQQIHRTISKEEMLHLFDFSDDENLDTSAELVVGNGHMAKDKVNGETGNCLEQKPPLSHGTSSDKLMENLIERHSPRWIANYHEHETLLQENEDEKLSKEEKDMAWEVYQKSLEWEEIQRVPSDDSAFEHKPAQKQVLVEENGYEHKPSSPNNRPLPKSDNFKRASSRNRFVQRKCTNLSHLLTLRSLRTKEGCSTICGECSEEISWEDLHGDGKSIR